MIRQLLRRLGRSGGGLAESAEPFVLYARCDHCGEVVRVRIDPRWEFVQELDDGLAGYTLQKELVGSACNRVITVRMAFDRFYRITAREIEGGQFATRDEFDAYQTGPGRLRRPGR